MNYTEFPVFPMITHSKKVDSPVDSTRWLEIVSIPKEKLGKPPVLSKRAAVLRVGDWLVLHWEKAEKLIGSESHEVALYEAFKGDTPPNTIELGTTPIRAIWRDGWASLITAPIEIEVLQGFRGPPARRRHAGAVVESNRAIQIWTKIQQM